MEKKIETVYQEPDSRLHVKISQDNDDHVNTSAQKDLKLGSAETASVDASEGVPAEVARAFGESHDGKEAGVLGANDKVG